MHGQIIQVVPKGLESITLLALLFWDRKWPNMRTSLQIATYTWQAWFMSIRLIHSLKTYSTPIPFQRSKYHMFVSCGEGDCPISMLEEVRKPGTIENERRGVLCVKGSTTQRGGAVQIPVTGMNRAWWLAFSRELGGRGGHIQPFPRSI